MEAAKQMTKPSPKKDPFTDLEEMLRTMSVRLVDHPDEIVIFPAPGQGFVHFEVRCNKDDLGTLIGRRGAHAEAMRMLLSAAATVQRVRVTVQFLALDGGGHGGR